VSKLGRTVAVALCLGLALLAPRAVSGAEDAATPLGPAGAVLPTATLDGAPTPDPTVLAELLSIPLGPGSLGSQVGAVVFDPATGVLLYDEDGDTPRTPGSVLKILTAVAVLDAVEPSARITTAAHYDAATTTLVLVGAGDPSLSSMSSEGSSLSALADEVIAASDGPGSGATVALTYDTSLFEGPAIATGWSPDYPAMGVAAPVSALVVDGARIPGSDMREADPARAAAEVFADLLRQRGLTVSSVAAGSVGSAPSIAQTRSVPLAQLVQRMLTTSDNDYAEILGHLAGATRYGVGSFATGAHAVDATLTAMGISTTGITLFDGSGLSVDNLVPARTFGQVLSALTRTSATGAVGGWSWPVLGGLAVAGVTGTLADRFYGPESYSGAGIVRAKTGTLTGVSGLAGTVVDREGRLLVFAFITNSAADTYDARAALDDAAAVLARCGCR
jgi:serine-type D-Ala-D-Ala carboxypeptidase/endopeptidase (penicillin-binding protein 4)